MYQKIKRVLDIIISIGGIFLLSPILLVIAILVKLQDGGPIIFKQKRVGKGGKLFNFYKFRSMPVNTANVPSAEFKKIKITPFGKILRRTNLDELPQLYNILIGDMSIIGPRPPIPSQIDLISLRHENRSINIRPGLTGWAQVNSFDAMPVEVKAAFDGEYARSISFSMDVKIILRTLVYLTKRPPTY
jgi:O-antigen biosynthesis protein WbqP